MACRVQPKDVTWNSAMCHLCVLAFWAIYSNKKWHTAMLTTISELNPILPWLTLFYKNLQTEKKYGLNGSHTKRWCNYFIFFSGQLQQRALILEENMMIWSTTTVDKLLRWGAVLSRTNYKQNNDFYVSSFPLFLFSSFPLFLFSSFPFSGFEFMSEWI